MEQEKRYVLLTNIWLEKYQGSEVNCLSLACALRDFGYIVEIATFAFGYPIRAEFERENLCVKNILTEKLERAHYDLIWSHHGILLSYFLFEQGITAEKVICSSLSSFEPYEVLPCYANEMTMCLANSAETKRFLISEGVKADRCYVFPNYIAQKDFTMGRPAPPEKLQHLAVVSNHIPPEMNDALQLLREQGFSVDVFGLGYRTELVTAELLLQYDAVASIGKTVQYGLGLNIPVYCYDIHGGPGWLSRETLPLAFDHNFSGRGFAKKSSAEIAEELVYGFSGAIKETAALREFCRSDCILEDNLQKVLSFVEAAPALDLPTVLQRYGFVRRENLAMVRLFCENQALNERTQICAELQQTVKTVQKEIGALQDQNRELQITLHSTIQECDALRDHNAAVALENEMLRRNSAEVEQLSSRLLCTEGECQQLRDKENRLLNELESMRRSRGWRAAQFASRLFHRIFPRRGKDTQK